MNVYSILVISLGLKLNHNKIIYILNILRLLFFHIKGSLSFPNSSIKVYSSVALRFTLIYYLNLPFPSEDTHLFTCP